MSVLSYLLPMAAVSVRHWLPKKRRYTGVSRAPGSASGVKGYGTHEVGGQSVFQNDPVSAKFWEARASRESLFEKQ